MMVGNVHKNRCIFENAEISVSHSFCKFPNGSVDAVLLVSRLRDGKCYFVETGSTSIPETSPNFLN